MTESVPRPLAGQAALVTGGGSGIGFACSRSLLRDGASVTIAGRSEHRLDEALARLRAEAPRGARVERVAGSVEFEDDVRRMVDGAITSTGSLDLVVAAAGAGGASPLVGTGAEEWERLLTVNVTGAFFTLKHAVEAMIASGGGAAVAVSSIAAVLTHRLMTPYAVSKAALEALVRNAADELGPSGVRVNAVRVGLVPTDLSAPLAGDEGIVGDYLEQMPLGRLGTADDVAAAVRFLLGPESSWITGQCLAVDGGHTLRRGPDFTRRTSAPAGRPTVDA